MVGPIIFIFNWMIRNYFASFIEFYVFSSILFFQTIKSNEFCNNYSVELLNTENDPQKMRSHETTERTLELENKTSPGFFFIFYLLNIKCIVCKLLDSIIIYFS